MIPLRLPISVNLEDLRSYVGGQANGIAADRECCIEIDVDSHILRICPAQITIRCFDVQPLPIRGQSENRQRRRGLKQSQNVAVGSG